MKEKRILNALEQVDETYIKEASPTKQKAKKPVWIRWTAVAVAACVCVVVGIKLVPFHQPNLTSIGGVMREYDKDVDIAESTDGIVWPWEYRTIYERFHTIVFNGKEYTIGRGQYYNQSVSDIYIGEKLGIGEGIGYGDDFNQTDIHSQNFDIWQINGINPELMVAAEMDGQFYAFSQNEYDPPETLGEVLDNYSLPQDLELLDFSEYKDGKEIGYYSMTNNDYIWQVLSDCREARFVEDQGYFLEDGLCFSATSNPLVAYKCAFSVSSDGYINTNIFGWGYTFHIGEKAAADIISYAKKNAHETDNDEPFTYSLSGTLTEIGDGYILVDDSILCKDEKDGMTFKVLTSDVRISRCLDYQGIGVGSIVYIEFTEPVDVQDGNTISSAISMRVACINNGDIDIPE